MHIPELRPNIVNELRIDKPNTASRNNNNYFLTTAKKKTSSMGMAGWKYFELSSLKHDFFHEVYYILSCSHNKVQKHKNFIPKLKLKK